MPKRVYISTLCYSLGFLLVFLFIFSCGSRRTIETKRPETRLARYTILEVPGFRTSLTGVPSDVLWRIPNRVVTILRDEWVFPGVTRSSVDQEESVLVLEGTVVSYSTESGFRKLIGDGLIGVHVRLFDKANGRVVAEATVEGTVKAGIFGGGMDTAYRHVAREIVDFIRSYY